MNAPRATKKPDKLVLHGHTRVDDYFWMNQRENPEVISYLEAENAYTEEIMSPLKKLREDLFLEMKARIKEDDSSVPYFKNGYWYYTRYEEGSEYAIFCRKKDTLETEEEIMLDENEMAKEHPYYDIVSFSITRDNSILAFTEDITGRRQYRIRFKDLKSGNFLNPVIENCSSDLAWHNDNQTLYYCLKDPETLRPYLIKSFHLATEKSTDIYLEEDNTFICGISKSTDQSTLFIGAYSTLSTEHYYKSADDHEAFKVFHPREDDHEYYPEKGADCFYIKTNKDAQNFRIVRAEFDQHDCSNWKTIQEHSEEIFIEDFEVFRDYLIIQEKLNGLSQLRVYRLNDMSNKLIPSKEETFTIYFGTNSQFDVNLLRVGYSSMTTPHSVYDISMDSFEWELKKQQEVLGMFKAEDYQSERIWATAEDGKRVPCSLVYRKDKFSKDGSNPTLLYAYGSYGSTIDPYFSSVRLSLLDRGFVFAIAHIRGGEYLGRQWYDDGKLLKKKNTFTDFIAVGEHLIREKYASPDKLFAMGGSAGGLLMGAISNMRPDLWKGIVSHVPFVDVISTMIDDSIPLTTGEYDEWGNPNNKEYYDYILSYSPYDQLESKDYPAMLITSGLHDSQVQYWEPTKYVAKLRELKTDHHTLLLYTNMDAGHGGASGRFEALKEIALDYAFILGLRNGDLG